jgi:hypothetical protein
VSHRQVIDRGEVETITWELTKEQFERIQRNAENDTSGKALRELLERSRRERAARERERR